MKAFVTSVGEPTEALSVWALQRNGFEVVLINDINTTLAQKLKVIYDQAEADFVRIDSDVIVNKNFTPEFIKKFCEQLPDVWWWQFVVFDWFKLDIAHSMGYITTAAIPALRANIGRFEKHNRPETEMSRIAEFYDPRRFATYDDEIFGLHGYRGDIARAKILKGLRNQLNLYDFEMAERLNKL